MSTRVTKTDIDTVRKRLGRRITEKEYMSRMQRVRNMCARQMERSKTTRDNRPVHWLIGFIRRERMRMGFLVPMIAAAAEIQPASWSNYEDGRNTLRALLVLEKVLAFMGYRLSIEPIPDIPDHPVLNPENYRKKPGRPKKIRHDGDGNYVRREGVVGGVSGDSGADTENTRSENVGMSQDTGHEGVD